MVGIKIKLYMTTFRNLQRIIQGFWNMPKKLFHFIAAFHVKLITEKLHAVYIIPSCTGRNTHLDIVSLRIIGIDIVKVIRTY